MSASTDLRKRTDMEKWRIVYRDGILPNISRSGLLALEKALLTDDPRLLQGTTCYPPLLDALRDRAVEGACFIGLCGWLGDGLATVGKVEKYFQRICDAADTHFNEVAACRYVLNFYDDTPRKEMRREFLGEVRRELAGRMP